MEDHSKKLRIAMVCDPVTDYTAGSYISTLRFAEILKKRGHHIIFIAAKSPISPKTNYYKDIKVYRFSSVLLPKTEKRLYLALPAIYQLKKIFKQEKIDVVHALLPTPANAAAVRAAKRLHIPVVAHSHTQPENLFLHIPKTLTPFVIQLNKAFYRYMKWLYQQAKVIIYPTEFARQIFVNMALTNPSVIISNGVDTSYFSPKDPTAFQQKNGIDPTADNILFVGRLHPEKSIGTLIRSIPLTLAQHPTMHLYIVGGGHEEPKLKKLAAKLNMTDHVHFLGAVSDEELVMSYSACKVLVLPSLAELEGMVVLEAMACGSPIMVANAPGSAATYFVRNNGMLFQPEDTEDLAHKLHLMLSDADKLKQMGEASRLQSLSYDIQESASKLEAVYYSVL